MKNMQQDKFQQINICINSDELPLKIFAIIGQNFILFGILV